MKTEELMEYEKYYKKEPEVGDTVYIEAWGVRGIFKGKSNAGSEILYHVLTENDVKVVTLRKLFIVVPPSR